MECLKQYFNIYIIAYDSKYVKTSEQKQSVTKN